MEQNGVRNHQDAGIPLTEAAVRMGISTEVLRKRLAKDQVPGYKEGNRWFVVLPDQDASSVHPNGQQDVHPDPSGRCQDDQDGHPEASGLHPDGSKLLIEQLRSEVAFLREELQQRSHELSDRSEELRRKDHIIAGLVERVPALPSETRPAEPTPAPASPISVEPWWKRLFSVS